VLGLASSFGLAFWKAQEAIVPLPTHGTVLITVAECDRTLVGEVARRFVQLGFKIKATAGTHACLASQGIPSEAILKEYEGRPNITDAIKNGEIQIVINTPAGKLSKYDDSYIRKTAVAHRVAYITALTAAMAAARGIEAYREGKSEVRSLQSYHADIV
jgi:carbamoyl-phosphate synthase large subunit